MGTKTTDECKTQYKITNRLNKMVDTDNRAERENINHELRELTHGFWYQKYKAIRRILQSSDTSENKCLKVKKALDTPNNAIEEL